MSSGRGAAPLKANPSFVDIQAAITSPTLEPLPNVFLGTPEPPGWETTGFQWVKDTYGAAAVAKKAALWGSTELQSFHEQLTAAISIGYKYIYNRGPRRPRPISRATSCG